MTEYDFLHGGSVAHVEHSVHFGEVYLTVRWMGREGRLYWSEDGFTVKDEDMRALLMRAARRSPDIYGVEALVLRDHDEVVGKTLLVNEACVFVGDDNDWHVFDPPLAVEVLAMSDENLLASCARSGDIADPSWDVECLDPTHPGIPRGGRVSWIDGWSRTGQGRVGHHIVLEDAPGCGAGAQRGVH